MQTFTGLLGSLNNSLRYSSTRGAAILSGSDPPMSRQTYLNLKKTHVSMCIHSMIKPPLKSGCKESQFYSLPARQAVSSMY